MAGLGDKLATKGTRLSAGPQHSPAASVPVRYLEIDPTRIAPNPDQPRRDFDPVDLERLAASIQDVGVLEPLLVRLEGGRPVLVAGERRLRAARLAGAKVVPCVVSEGDPALLALIENLHRKDLTPLEEAEGLARLQQSHGLDLAGLAAIAGKALSTVSELLSLARLPQAVKAQAQAQPDKFPRRYLVELAKEPPARAEALAVAATAGAHRAEDVRAARRERKTAGPAAKPAQHKRAGDSESARLDALFRRAETLAAELDNLDLPGLDYRQRAVARHACKRLAQSMDRVFSHLKQSARQDDERWTPARQARLLELVSRRRPSGGLSYAALIMGKEINEDGKPLHPSEVAAQVALARQAEKERAAKTRAAIDTRQAIKASEGA